MNAHQRAALASPQARAVGRLSEFTRAMRVGSISLSTILTVNK
jgi:hypothetical protein